MSNLRFTKYDVSCDAEDFMSDVKETWEATYESIDWIYQEPSRRRTCPNFVTAGNGAGVRDEVEAASF